MGIEAMKQALEALELMYACYAHPEWISHKQQEEKILAQCVATTMTLRQAIKQAEKEQQRESLGVCLKCGANECGSRDCPMNTQPQQKQAEKQEPVALEWDEVYDAAAAAYCRSEASRKALRLCFQTRQQTTQISIGWTANELMAFVKTIAYVCTTPQPQREFIGLTDEEIGDFASGYRSGRIGSFVELTESIEAKLKEKNT